MFGNTNFKKLLEPYHIGKVKTRNRMVKTSAGTCYGHHEDLHLREMARVYYEALARGGVGLLIVETPTIDFPLSTTVANRCRIDDDKYIPLMRELADAIHQYGCPTFLQLYHAGPWHRIETFGQQPVAASPVIIESGLNQSRDKPRALSIPEIKNLVDKFASAAVRAKKAGFDGVEINASMSHLLASFLSPFWNKREDVYGRQSLEGRARFLLEIIHEIKSRAGKDFPISVLMNAIELGGGDEGMTEDECLDLAIMLQEAGVDALHVRFYWIGFDLPTMHPESFFYPEPYIPLKDFPKGPDWSHMGVGANLPLAARIRDAVSIPVITAGKLDPVIGEKALRNGKTDFIGLCRTLMADPELPNKVAAGRLDDIIPCAACKECMSNYREPIKCRVNANLGTEREYVPKQAKKKKRIMVIGGGPAGMEAARVAALRGHEVMLYEREHKLGGLLAVGSIVKGNNNEDMPSLIRYFHGQIKKLGVKVFLGKNVDLSIIDDVRPDAVVIATGGLQAIPNIRGIDNKKVINNSELHRRLKRYLRFVGPGILGWLTKIWMPVGKRVVIMGGALQGCQLAIFLVKRGRSVTILEISEELGEGIPPHLKVRVLWWFDNKGVIMMPGVKYEEITDDGITVVTKEGHRKIIEADTIIPAIPLNPNIGLFNEIEGKVPEIYNIGDSKEPRLSKQAIADASRIAYDI